MVRNYLGNITLIVDQKNTFTIFKKLKITISVNKSWRYCIFFNIPISEMDSR